LLAQRKTLKLDVYGSELQLGSKRDEAGTGCMCRFRTLRGEEEEAMASE
jgi:hypothetical protein